MNQFENLPMLTNGQLEELYLEAKKLISISRYYQLQQSGAPKCWEEGEFVVLYREMRERGLLTASLEPILPVREYDPIHDSLDRLQWTLYFMCLSLNKGKN